MTTPHSPFTERTVQLSDGTQLALRTASGPKRPFLLVHGLASNALMWELVGERLAAAGHEVVAVDLRGHGRSARPVEGYSTAQSSADLAQLIELMAWGSARHPVVAGQSWGGNVVLHLAAHTDAVHSVVAVDGGWIHLAERYPTFDECWQQLTPPDFDSTSWHDLRQRLSRMLEGWPEGSLNAVLGNLEHTEGGGVRSRLAREHHRSIVHSLWADNPVDYYPTVAAPTLFLVAGDSVTSPEKAASLVRATAALADTSVRWYPGAHHDLHLQHPDRVAEDLLLMLESPTPEVG